MSSDHKFRVLVVDDEPLVCEITSLILEENGGVTLEAGSGTEGLNLFNAHKGTIDVVFLDFSMPGKNGYDTFKEMHTADNTVGYIMGSGLAMTNEVAACQARGEIEFLSKPFNENELMGAVRRALKKRNISL